ncbi:MAG: alpha/beta fold hydrolase [Candidatus Geothermincolales bacterium]
MAEVMKGAEPFFFDGGEVGVLVLHGFTGTTQSVRPLGEGLAAEGFTVLGPRLPGHGTDIQDLSTRSWTEWAAEAERGLKVLRERCSRVFVTGLSMGGTLTLYLGERYPDEVAGLMPINAAVDMKNPFFT